MATRLVRTSELGTYRRCRQKWFWTFQSRLRPKFAKPALRFGDLWHQALAEYYRPGLKRGPHPAKTFVRLYDEQLKTISGFGIRDVESEEWVNARDMGVNMAEAYIDRYGKDSDLYIIAPEFAAEVAIKDAGGRPLLYVMRFDAVFRYRPDDTIGLFEHKTASALNINHLAMDEQANAYDAFAPTYLRKLGIMKSGQKIDFILYNLARKAKRDDRPRDDNNQVLKKNGEPYKRQPPDNFLRHNVYRDDPERRAVLRRIRQETWEIRMVESGKLPVFKNITRDCPWECQFFDMCELHETGDAWREFARQNFTVADPYDVYHEEGIGIS